MKQIPGSIITIRCAEHGGFITVVRNPDMAEDFDAAFSTSEEALEWLKQHVFQIGRGVEQNKSAVESVSKLSVVEKDTATRSKK